MAASADDAAKAQYALAGVYAEKKNYRKAVEAFQTLVSVYPEHELAPEALFESAKIYGNRLKDKVKMIEMYERIGSEFPNTWECAKSHQELEQVYLAAKDVENAYKHITERKKVLDALIARLRASLHAGASIEEAARAQYRIGELCLEKKDYQGAATEFQRLSDNYPKHDLAPQALFRVGELHKDQLKDEAKMTTAYEKLMSQYPDHELAFKALDIMNRRGGER